MKLLHIKKIQILFLAASIIMSAALVKIVGSYLFAIRRYVVSIDPLFSDSIGRHLKDTIEHLPCDHFPSMDSLFKQLKNQFPTIKSMSMEFIAPGVIHCAVESEVPLVLMNNQVVLTDSGMVIQKELFALYKISRLYDVEVKQALAVNSMAPEALYEAMLAMPANVFSRFRISWVNEFECWFHDKQNAVVSLLCTAKTLPNEQIMKQCEQCTYEVVQQGVQGRKVCKHWIADVRFDKQIILYAERGGGAHG